MFSPQQSTAVPDIYVIDTQTGRIWRRVFYTDIKELYLVPQPYLTADELAASAVPTDGIALESLSFSEEI